MFKIGIQSADFIRNSISKRTIHRIAIVGSGPSGFYTAKYLLEKCDQIQVDLYEKLPVPFGLVRFGVAPDHPEVKNVCDGFFDAAKSNRFRYFGNVLIGDSFESLKRSNHCVIPLRQLVKNYSGTVLAYGASSDRSLDLQYEDKIHGIFSAREFVNWYNGHPDNVKLHEKFNLNEVKDVVIVGHGNVALDIARILAKDPKDLLSTDMSSVALEILLHQSNIETVTIIGRRGAIQAAFTIKELREISKLESASLFIDEIELQLSWNPSTEIEIKENRPKKRISELIQSIATGCKSVEKSGKKKINLRFLWKPMEINFTKDNRVKSLVGQRTVLSGEPFRQIASVTDDKIVEEFPCQLLLKAIGYKSIPICKSLPFNYSKHTVPHHQGRVVLTKDASSSSIYESFQIPGLDTDIIKGLYVTGWLKRGPSGIIGTNIEDSKETVQSILDDIHSSRLHDCIDTFPQEIHPDIITWDKYLAINQEEIVRGQNYHPPKPREKILETNEMLKIANNGNHWK